LSLTLSLSCAAHADNGAVVPLTTVEQARAVIARPGPIVVLYHAEWCGVCREFMIEYFDAAARMPEVRFYMVDLDHGRGYKEHAKLVQFVPTVLVGKDEQSLRNHPCEVAKKKRDSATVMQEIKRCLK
jgi:thiol-disulfide isomerase/thioredoxin